MTVSILEGEVSQLEKDLDKIEGSETCARDYERGSERRREVLDIKAHHEGRRGGIVDQIRSLKVSIFCRGFPW